MTRHEQKPESAEFRTRREQLAFYPEAVCVGRYAGNSWQLELSEDDLDPDRLIEGPVMYVRCDIDHKRRKDAEGAEPVAWQWYKLIPGTVHWRIVLDSEKPLNADRATNLTPLYTRPANVAALIAEAVEAERERCAKICESKISGTAPDIRNPKPADYMTVSWDGCCEELAEAIREGGENV